MARGTLPHLLLAALLCSTAGCHSTASGRAVHARLGFSFSRLANAPATVFGSEMRRLRQIPAATNLSRWISPDHLTGAVRSTRTMLADPFDRVQRWPANKRSTAMALLAPSGRGLRNLIGNANSGARSRDRLGLALGDVRSTIRLVPDMLGLTKPILPGPLDLDRTDDPFQVGRGLTWVERLLMRF